MQSRPPVPMLSGLHADPTTVGRRFFHPPIRLYPTVEFPELDPDTTFDEYQSFMQRPVHGDEGLKEGPMEVLPEALGEEDQDDVCRVRRLSLPP